eukprot:Blabericola_migrator_1__13013@NODE_86_length_14718_cov_24_199236_g77_i0_p3_GENE_NODE_86_length_14718_cov_24_199236_g77_i0NODE_86_length_14718_cov_24_199236_g77_i0_p3_ORF_typecomplete_len541_score87_05Integrin_beta/PF00362_18/0_008Integrin_beta/PF00362_18/4_3e12VWA/PF00092_28/0_0011VWA/PF00092_28/0_074VWA_2/PF13519_6/1_3VWA_2/PF13519_6/0_64_NODE_86_length_14718_cov_24_199236_g77_i0912810750
MRSLTLMSVIALAALADDCAVPMNPEVMIVQDCTTSFTTLLPSIVSSLSSFVTELTKKYKAPRVGFLGFGDKYEPDATTGLSPTGKSLMSLPQALTTSGSSLVVTMKTWDFTQLHSSDDKGSNGLEAACYARGKAGFSARTNAYDRYLVVITDGEPHYNTGSNPDTPNPATTMYPQISKGYAGINQLSSCLEGTHLLVILTADKQAAWQTALTQLGFNSTNSLVKAMPSTALTAPAEIMDTVRGEIKTEGCAAGSTECGASRTPEVMLVQDSTLSFSSIIGATLAALPGFMDKLVAKYPAAKVGFMGFGDKCASQNWWSFNYEGAKMFQLPQPLTHDIDSIKSTLAGYTYTSVSRNGDNPENSLEALCYAAGMGGYTPYTAGDTSDTVTRFIVLITDNEAHWQKEDNPKLTDLPHQIYDDPKLGYPSLKQVSQCLTERGMKVVVLCTSSLVSWWEENLPKLGFNETNSAAVLLSISVTDTNQYTQKLFSIMEEQVDAISCKEEELTPTTTTTVEMTKDVATVTEAPVGGGDYDCCDLCLE